VPNGTGSQLAARRRNRVHRCPWGDGDTQRLRRFWWLFQPGSRREVTARRVGTHGAELHKCGAGVVNVRFAAFALRLHEVVASREACDTRSAPGLDSIEAGDGLTAMPLLILR